MTRFGLGLFVSLLLLSTAAHAQEGPAGDGAAAGMPDPRQMSGIPRPDTGVPLGTVTVRVVQGGLAFPAPADTVVHLVGIGAKGQVTRISKPIGKASRAEFSALATDGSVVYYALALLGEDRLESQEITPTKMAGVRLLLAGRKLGPDGKPVGEPVDDQRRGDGGTSTEPVVPGEVHVALRGEGPFEAVELHEVLAEGGTRPIGSARAETHHGGLRAVFRGIEGGADKVYLARLSWAGRTFHSRPFMLSPVAGARATILSVAPLLFGLHAGGQLDDDKLWFEAQVIVANLTGAPYDPGADGLRLPLPIGFLNGSVRDEAMQAKVKVVPGEGLIWKAPIPPGQQEVVVQWAHQVVGGRVDFELPAPQGLVEAQVVLEQVPGATITPPAGAQARLTQAESGRYYYMMSGLTVPPGGAIRFRVDGLPQPSGRDRAIRLGVGALVLGLLGLGLFWAVKTPARASVEDTAARRKRLVAERERLFDELVRVEKRRAKVGRGADARLERERQDLVVQLAALHREIDLIDSLAASRRKSEEG